MTIHIFENKVAQGLKEEGLRVLRNPALAYIDLDEAVNNLSYRKRVFPALRSVLAESFNLCNLGLISEDEMIVIHTIWKKYAIVVLTSTHNKRRTTVSSVKSKAARSSLNHFNKVVKVIK